MPVFLAGTMAKWSSGAMEYESVASAVFSVFLFLNSYYIKNY